MDNRIRKALALLLFLTLTQQAWASSSDELTLKQTVKQEAILETPSTPAPMPTFADKVMATMTRAWAKFKTAAEATFSTTKKVTQKISIKTDIDSKVGGEPGGPSGGVGGSGDTGVNGGVLIDVATCPNGQLQLEPWGPAYRQSWVLPLQKIVDQSRPA